MASPRNLDRELVCQNRYSRGVFRQEMDASLPDGMRKLSANCIVERSGGMGSHFGFIGTYVSLLLSLDTNTVWDARSCDAT